MPNPRHQITGPTITPAPFGLLSAVEVRDDPDPRWRNGVEFRSTCPSQASATVAPCSADVVGDLVIPPKTGTRGAEYVEGPAVTLYAVHECAPIGETAEQAQAEAGRKLVAAEGPALELVVSTGDTEAGVLAEEFRLNGSTTNVLPGPPTGQPLLNAFGFIEAELAKRGVGVIYMPRAFALWLISKQAVVRNGSRLESALGTPVVAMNYDFGTHIGPDGRHAGDGIAWIYGTGPAIVYRGGVTYLPGFDSDVNTRTVIAERTYAYAWECGAFAVPVDLSTLSEE